MEFNPIPDAKRRRFMRADGTMRSRTPSEREPNHIIPFLRLLRHTVELSRLRVKLVSEHTSALATHQRTGTPYPRYDDRFTALNDMTQRRDVKIARLLQTVQPS